LQNEAFKYQLNQQTFPDALAGQYITSSQIILKEENFNGHEKAIKKK
jgi:hypothetical protein